MGILPLEFTNGESAKLLGLTGRERFYILGIEEGLKPRQAVTVRALADDGTETEFTVRSRIDTPVEGEYYQNGVILQYVLRQLLNSLRRGLPECRGPRTPGALRV